MIQSAEKKVLIVTGIYPPDIGGPATLLAVLPRALRANGLAVKILTYSDIAATIEEKTDGVFRIRRGRFSRWRYFWRMLRLSFWSDVVYATDLYSVGWFAWLIKKLIGLKYLIRFAGDSAWEKAVMAGWTNDFIVDFEIRRQSPILEKWKDRRRLILKEADGVIAVSRFMADLAERIGADRDKIKMIYNAVDFFENLPPRQESSPPILVFSGRLVPWKSQAVILNVLMGLKNNYPDIVFEVLGDGPGLAGLRELARVKGLAANVRFRGRIAEEQTYQIFARATIFVLNTNYEGMSHAILNAMRVGLPVIASAAGGNAELINSGENGLLVPYNDEAAWRTAIEKLLIDSSLRIKLAQNAKKTLEKFKFEEMVRETIEMIKRC